MKTLPSNSKYEQFILAKYFILPSSQQSKTVSNFIKILSKQIESKIGTKINPKDECDTTQLVNSWNTILNRECQKISRNYKKICLGHVPDKKLLLIIDGLELSNDILNIILLLKLPNWIVPVYSIRWVFKLILSLIRSEVHSD